MSSHSILMLEYDEDDRDITVEHFRELSVHVDLEIVGSSEEVLASLLKAERSGSKLPSLLLLNYNSTPMNATELLAALKSSKAFRHIPVIVLSGTVIPGIVRECYAAGAATFIQKPALLADTRRKISNFVEYWFSTAEL